MLVDFICLTCFPSGIYLFKANDGKTNVQNLSKVQRQWRRSGVLIVNFEQISRVVLFFPLLTLNK